MEILPRGVAATLDQLASACAYRAASERSGSKTEVKVALQNIDRYSDDLAMQFRELGLDDVDHHAILDIFTYTGWHAANERAKYKKDAARDDAQVAQAVAKLIANRHVSQDLAERIKNLGGSWGWYAANTKKGYHRDAELDAQRIAVLKTQIVGDWSLDG